MTKKSTHPFIAFALLTFAFISSASASGTLIKKGKKTVIIGSYRKFYPEVCNKIDKMNEKGVAVLAPPKSKIVNPGEEFILFASNKKNETVPHIESEFLKSLSESDFVYVVNVGGYIGIGSAMEIGYAHGLGKPIYCMMKPTDPSIATLCTAIVPLK